MALSVGSPPLGVTQHPALWSPDFPPARSRGPATIRLPLVPLSKSDEVVKQYSAGTWDDLGYTPPNIEEPYRALTCLYNVARGRALLHGRRALVEEDLALVTHVALSSAPQKRTKLLRALVEYRGRDDGRPGGTGVARCPSDGEARDEGLGRARGRRAGRPGGALAARAAPAETRVVALPIGLKWPDGEPVATVGSLGEAR